MKGIVLAGGSGTRLYPATLAICKQLLPVYDKPMIYYPLSTLMLAGIREILIISTPEDTPRFTKLLSDGSHLGLMISYKVQQRPEGIAQSLLIAESFIQNESIALVLGDNLFHGHRLSELLQDAAKISLGGLIFGYHVKDPHQYGVLSFDEKMRVVEIEEKPKIPKTNYAVPGLYFYGPEAVEMTKRLTPSKRGELEITDLNSAYLAEKRLEVRLLGRGIAWLDTGSFDTYHKAAAFVQNIQERQGIKIACLEEIAYRMGYISRSELLAHSKRYKNNEYGEYLAFIAEQPL
jgi:glucose-1-phosphate thymidylyltransferase